MNEMQKTAVRVSIAALIALLLVSACRPTPAPPASETYTVTSESTTRPTTALDPSGAAAYVAWVAKDDSLANVYVARLDRPGGSDVSRPVRVNQKNRAEAGHKQAAPHVAVAPE